MLIILKQVFLKYFNERHFHVGLNLYYTLLDNYITRDYFQINNASTILYDEEEGVIVANMNKGRAYILGSTFTFKGSINNHLFTRGSLTYTKGKAYDTEEPLSSIPPLFGLLEFGFEKEKFQASLSWNFNAKKNLEDYNLREGIDNIEQTPYIDEIDAYYGNPSWSIINVSSMYKMNKGLTLFLNVDNIFDLHYKEFASSISAPGRNISISALVNI